jgi:hypothetical protein
VLCYPRLALWPERTHAIWYLEAILLFGGFVLWAFVFAWHTPNTKLPVFTLSIGRREFGQATMAGAGVAIAMFFLVDPVFRVRTPEEYPVGFDEWLARVLFGMAFLQLFLVFAPFAWLIRLFRHKRLAMVLTVAFGVAVLLVKTSSAADPPGPGLLAIQVLVRATLGFLTLWFYLRGGVLLAWWWGLLIQSRNLLMLDRAG